MKSDILKGLVPTEAELCRIFIEEANALPGWVCHPETGGFDILMAHESGRQIGIEAKLQLNAKVAEQIVPSEGMLGYEVGSPDHRMVIVRHITDANAGIAKLLGYLGIAVIGLRDRGDYYSGGSRLYFDLDGRFRCEALATGVDSNFRWGEEKVLFDWNPATRVMLPDVPSGVVAGAPSPVQMTPWKMAAVRVLARLRAQGCITAKEIKEEGCSPSIWIQSYLERGPVRGQWVEGPNTRRVDLQHPELYAVALEKAKAAHAERQAQK